MPTSNKTDAISNGNRYESNRLFATASELGGNRFAATAVSIGNPCPGIFPEVQNITPTWPASASATMSATHFCRANWICCSATSKLTEEHHDPANVKNDLDDKQKLRAQLQENPRGREQRGDQKDGAVDYVPPRHHERRARHGNARKEIK